LHQDNIYQNDKEILYLKNYLQKTFYNFEIENRINELELTQEDIDKMNNILDKFDKSNDGELDIEELNNVFICMGINLNFQSLMEIFKKSDINKDGKINKQEFILLMKKNIFSKTQNNNYNNSNYNDLKIEG
jgi:Ca2+-binding EF-hand superfamily protein